jgi:hypothetical protein
MGVSPSLAPVRGHAAQAALDGKLAQLCCGHAGIVPVAPRPPPRGQAKPLRRHAEAAHPHHRLSVSSTVGPELQNLSPEPET